MKLADISPELDREFTQACSGLLESVQSAWTALDDLLTGLASEPGGNGDGQSSLETQAAVLLEQPLKAFSEARAAERVLDALEHYREWRQQVLWRIPERITQPTGRRRSPREIPARQLVSDLLRDVETRRGRLYGEALVLLAQACLEIVTPWQMTRRTALRRNAGIQGATPEPHWRPRWQRHITAIRKRGARLLRRLAEPPSRKLAGKPRAESKRGIEERLLESRMSYWRRMCQAVSAALRLEADLVEASRRIYQCSQASVRLLSEEHDSLLAELDHLAAWLEQPYGSPPDRQTRLLEAEERTEEWMRALIAAVCQTVPAQVESVVPRRPLPGWRKPWRVMAPQRELLQALQANARPPALEGFRQAAALHRTAVNDMERARQVIAFAEEMAAREGEAGKAAGQEAISNALSLLRHRRSVMPDIGPTVGARLDRATALALYGFHLKLERDRFGVWRHVARQGARQVARAGREWASAALKSCVRRGLGIWRRLAGHLLVRIGWERLATARLPHVERRELLSERLGVELAPRQVPLIYQRLFRPEPVEDSRFLAGRQAEMAAMEELRRLWEAGRPAAAVLVGERGSGKTSLLNCALKSVFRDVEVVRTQFQERICDPAGMRRFLEQQVRLEPGRRSMVILEEVERSFLRRINGYDGLRELLATIAASSRRTLWVLAMNRTAFQLLKAAVDLERYFSHRLNAASVEPEHLREAILLRHNLSGLRLHFLPPPDNHRAGSRARRILGLESDVEQLFFEALYRESEGLFRSAFQLWLQHIERTDGGVIYMRHIEKSDYEPLLGDLALEDFFTLQAIMQHGSLTVEEHAEVFQLGIRASLERLEILEDRELIQPDPGRAGYRVRPEAGRAVRMGLHRRNLLS